MGQGGQGHGGQLTDREVKATEIRRLTEDLSISITQHVRKRETEHGSYVRVENEVLLMACEVATIHKSSYLNMN